MKNDPSNINVSKFIPGIFRNNTPGNNLLLILFFVTVIVVFIDLGSELSAEKDEIGTFLACLENTETDSVLPLSFLSDIDRPLLFEATPEDLLPPEQTLKNPVFDRGPPDLIS
ncbi:MAG: hypothetical protein JSS91_14445 [Bacteroidetes bacterium]|nr:hypothetical protein [Bacteroidota bacterium]